ncbi:hypothetical protein, variant [Phialophora macrospora]|uniref:Uncharacterized protein n=1 Tax=Phialophora macrospora TaxID=1851006 RepID=A0A0D2DR67_9EURO|nr:hypothetical protein, variant [Phialophora macrospora]
MVVLKHFVLASLAALTVASSASTQWEKPDGSAADVAHQGRPSGAAADNGAGPHGHGSWQQPGKGQAGYDEDKNRNEPGGNDGGADKHNQHEPRDVERSDDAPTGHTAHGRPSGALVSGGPQEHGSGQHSGKEESGYDTHKAPTGMEDNVNKHSKHQAREDATPKNWGHRDDKWEYPPSPGKDGDDDHHNRHQTRDANPSIDLDHDDPILSQMRKILAGDNETDSQEHEGRHHLNRRGVKGVYECMNHDFVAPCKWTEIKSESQCYNAVYDARGSMGPDKGLCCTIYEMKNCNSNGWQTIDDRFRYPGIPNYGYSQLLLNEGFNDEGIVSIKCKFRECTK